MRLALGLDEPAVQRAYQGLYKQSLNTIFVPRITLIERLRWVSTAVAKRLDSLPPFWTTFLLVITLSLPQAVLALPIATAGLGPLRWSRTLVFFGFFNVLTMACMAEAFGAQWLDSVWQRFHRPGGIRLHGQAGSLFLVSATAMRLFIGLMACYYGLSVTMASLTSISPGVWAALLFLLALYLLAGKSLNFSTALSALLGAVSISLSLGHLSGRIEPRTMGESFLRQRPSRWRASFRPRHFASHLRHRHPVIPWAYLPYSMRQGRSSPRSRRRLARVGNSGGQCCHTVLLCGWVLVANGALAPSAVGSASRAPS